MARNIRAFRVWYESNRAALETVAARQQSSLEAAGRLLDRYECE
jgi:hypothetical protein